MLKTPIGRLRLAGMIEAVSYLTLLGIAMPLKYAAGIPEAVQGVGWIHGILFIMLCLAIVAAILQAGLALRLAGLAFLAALLPFGPFVVDSRLKREQQQTATAARPDDAQRNRGPGDAG